MEYRDKFHKLKASQKYAKYMFMQNFTAKTMKKVVCDRGRTGIKKQNIRLCPCICLRNRKHFFPALVNHCLPWASLVHLFSFTIFLTLQFKEKATVDHENSVKFVISVLIRIMSIIVQHQLFGLYHWKLIHRKYLNKSLLQWSSCLKPSMRFSFSWILEALLLLNVWSSITSKYLTLITLEVTRSKTNFSVQLLLSEKF